MVLRLFVHIGATQSLLLTFDLYIIKSGLCTLNTNHTVVSHHRTMLLSRTSPNMSWQPCSLSRIAPYMPF